MGIVVHWMLSALVACSSDGEPTPATGVTDPISASETYPDVVATVVTLETRDSVSLAADLYAGQPGFPGVVLLHMTPTGGATRVDWPSSFISQLTRRGYSVIAVDRRGAGDSGGNAEDAYLGETGKYDTEAAVQALTEVPIGPLAILGASNGTTSMIDYAVWAPTQGLPDVAALGYMTGGTYSENQTAMATVPPVPAVFTYSTEEAAWSETQQALDPGTWSFLEYAGGDHGTRMFDARPEVADDLDGFLHGVLSSLR